MTPAIRPASNADSGQIAALIAQCWVRYPGNVLDIAGEEPVLRGGASAYAARGGRFWVAHRTTATGDWVVGCVGVVPTDATDAGAELVKLYVHPRLRRQGLARRLLALPEATAREWDAGAIELWSDTRFREAHVFYEATGYARTGETRRLDDLSQSAEYRFRKSLTMQGGRASDRQEPTASDRRQRAKGQKECSQDEVRKMGLRR